jgi:hypothetical protein
MVGAQAARQGRSWTARRGGVEAARRRLSLRKEKRMERVIEKREEEDVKIRWGQSHVGDTRHRAEAGDGRDTIPRFLN